MSGSIDKARGGASNALGNHVRNARSLKAIEAEAGRRTCRAAAAPSRVTTIRQFLTRTVASLCVVVLVALGMGASIVRAQVLVVLSDDSPIYRDVGAELTTRLASLRDGHLPVDVTTASAVLASDARYRTPYELIVTVGAGAAQAMLEQAKSTGTPRPTLCLLVSRQTFERLANAVERDTSRYVSAVFVEQPIARQLDLIRLALPGKTRIGAVFGPTSVAYAREMQDRARERGLELNRIDIADSGEMYPALQKILAGSDLLIALPDPVAVNASTVYNLLMTSYRAQIGVVGFSRATVDAGALLAVYSSARQQGRQAAEIAVRLLTGKGSLPAPQYPRYFTVAVNFFAARALGLSMEPESALAEALAEGGRESRGQRSEPDGVHASSWNRQ
jgi:putative tryptophan/tyrosine transport system substrate-binding protein